MSWTKQSVLRKNGHALIGFATTWGIIQSDFHFAKMSGLERSVLPDSFKDCWSPQACTWLPQKARFFSGTCRWNLALDRMVCCDTCSRVQLQWLSGVAAILGDLCGLGSIHEHKWLGVGAMRDLEASEMPKTALIFATFFTETLLSW